MTYALPGLSREMTEKLTRRPSGVARAGRPHPGRDAGGDRDPADALVAAAACRAKARCAMTLTIVSSDSTSGAPQVDRQGQPHRPGGASEHLDEHIAEALAAAEILKPRGEVLDFGSRRRVAGHSDGHRFAGGAVSPRGGGSEEMGLSEACRAGVRIERAWFTVIDWRAFWSGFPPIFASPSSCHARLGSPEEWVPSLREHLDGRRARSRSFRDRRTRRRSPGFEATRRIRCRAATSNYLVLLTFHVEH